MRKDIRKFAAVCGLATMMVTMTACSSSSNDAGKVFTGTAQGNGGEISVSVTIDSDKITKVEVKGDDETPGVADPAIEQLPQAIIDAQSADVDTIAGCTITSQAIIDATNAALTEAGFNN